MTEFRTLAEVEHWAEKHPELGEDDHFKCGNGQWHTLADLRRGLAPSPYALGLAQLRTAESTPQTDFDTCYAAKRSAEFAQTRASLDANPLELPRLTVAERAALPIAPKGYTLALAKEHR